MLVSGFIRRSRRVGAFDRNVVFALIAIGVVVAGLSVWRFRYTPAPVAVKGSTIAEEPHGETNSLESVPAKSTLLPNGWKLFGGVARPSTDVRVSFQDDNKARKKIYKLEGPSPKLAFDTNQETAQIAEALSGDRETSTLSSSVVPDSFDKERFQDNKEQYAIEYAKIIEPGRVFAAAKPGEGVPVIHADGALLHRVNQGERVRLVVNAAPGVPVAFTSMRLGSFSNQLSSITVVADRNGQAETTFTASSGTIAEIPILAASPVTSGQVRFVVSVAPKLERPNGPPGLN